MLISFPLYFSLFSYVNDEINLKSTLSQSFFPPFQLTARPCWVGGQTNSTGVFFLFSVETDQKGARVHRIIHTHNGAPMDTKRVLPCQTSLSVRPGARANGCAQTQVSNESARAGVGDLNVDGWGYERLLIFVLTQEPAREPCPTTAPFWGFIDRHAK